MSTPLTLFSIEIAQRYNGNTVTRAVETHCAHDRSFTDLTPAKRQAVIDALYEQAEHYSRLNTEPARPAGPAAPKKGGKPLRSKAEQEERYERFMALARGIPAHRVGRALTSLTPGIDFRQSTKSNMASAWATGVPYAAVARLSVGQLEAAFAPLRK